MLRHPQYATYTEDGVFRMDHYVTYPDAEARTFGAAEGNFEFGLVGVNYALPEVPVAWGREMAASCRMFGWDGVRFDGPAPRFDGAFAELDPLHTSGESPSRYGFDGRPVAVDSQKDRDRLSLTNMRNWLEEARRGNPRFELGMNLGRGLTREPTEMGDTVALEQYPQSLGYVGRQAGYGLFEWALSLGHPEMDTWDEWARMLYRSGSVAHELGMLSGVGHLRWTPGVTQRTTTYVAMASGYKLAYCASAPLSYFSGERNKAFRFAIRFGEFLYDTGYEKLPADQRQVTVEGHERLLWSYFVKKRTLEGGVTEWVVHLVNLPEEDTILRHHDPPPAREGTVVRFPLPEGRQVAGAWALLPEPPRAARAVWRAEGGRVAVDVPAVRAFATIVLRVAD